MEFWKTTLWKSGRHIENRALGMFEGDVGNNFPGILESDVKTVFLEYWKTT